MRTESRDELGSLGLRLLKTDSEHPAWFFFLGWKMSGFEGPRWMVSGEQNPKALAMNLSSCIFPIITSAITSSQAKLTPVTPQTYDWCNLYLNTYSNICISLYWFLWVKGKNKKNLAKAPKFYIKPFLPF